MIGSAQELIVDFLEPPEKRWCLTAPMRSQARELLCYYKADLGLTTGDLLTTLAKTVVEPAHWIEMEAVAPATEVPIADVALCNFYYDAMKVALGGGLGCTAFAVETPDGILHARNLDWWSDNAMLTRYTTVCRFRNAPAGDFTTIGWPGFLGAFSAVAPGRFAVTLNAVWSPEPARIATPVAFLLRTALETARSYADALRLLSDATLPCDCLLLLTGVRPGEMAVIERTPTRRAIRYSEDGALCVTNNYECLDTPGGGNSFLFQTACGRRDRIQCLLRERRPQNWDDCRSYLSDPGVKMNLTVQQMGFHARTGEHVVF